MNIFEQGLAGRKGEKINDSKVLKLKYSVLRTVAVNFPEKNMLSGPLADET